MINNINDINDINDCINIRIDNTKLPFNLTLGWDANNSINSLLRCVTKEERINLSKRMIKIHDKEIKYYTRLMNKIKNYDIKYNYETCVLENQEALVVYKYYLDHVDSVS